MSFMLNLNIALISCHNKNMVKIFCDLLVFDKTSLMVSQNISIPIKNE